MKIEKNIKQPMPTVSGFLSLKDENIRIPGNAGLKDQVLALKWIKANCTFFGGDSNCITVFGESAGGASAHYMMITDQARDLFHRAVLMSGSCLSPWALVPPRNWAYRLAALAGYKKDANDKKVWEFLKKAKASQILKAQTKLLNEDEKKNKILFAHGPSIEPYVMSDCVIPESPVLMMRKAWSNKIPVLIGGTSFEGLFAYPETRKNQHVLENIGNCEYLVPYDLNLDRESLKCKELGLKLKEAHFGDLKPGLGTSFEYLDALSYKYFWHSLSRTAQSRLLYAAKAPTYLYRFDFDSKNFNHIRIVWCGRKVRGVCHGDDLSYIFLNFFAEQLDQKSKEFVTIQRMTGMLVEFAKTGNPNYKANQHEWLPLTIKEEFKCMNIGNDLSFISLPENKKLEIWNTMYPKDQLF